MAPKFLKYTAIAVVVYLLVANRAGSIGLTQAGGTGAANFVKTLQGR